jgi:signal transduction histidine kinase/CheY-like chemotaxis protein
MRSDRVQKVCDIRRDAGMKSPVVMLCLLLMIVSPIAAADDEWTWFEKTVNSHRPLTDDDWRDIDNLTHENGPLVLRHADQLLARAEASGDKAALVKALRLWITAVLPGAVVYDANAIAKRVKTAIALATELGDSDALGWFLRAGSGYEGEEAAAQMLNRATVIAEQRKLDRLLAWIYVDRGRELSAQGRVGDAIASLTKAYALFEKRQDVHGRVHTLYTLTGVYLSGGFEGDKETGAKLIGYLHEALRLANVEKYPPKAEMFLYMLGVVHSRMNENTQARQYFERCREFSDKRRASRLDSDNETWASELEAKIALTFYRQGRYAEALARFDAALAGRPREYREDAISYSIMRDRALVLARLGRLNESRDAIARAQALIPLLQKQGILIGVKDYQETADVYQLLGDDRQAYQAMRLALAAQQRAATVNDQKLEREYKVRFDVQLKEAENTLLRSQQQQAETRRLALSLALALSLVLLVSVGYYLRKRAAAARLDAAHHKALAAAEAAASQAKSTFLSNMSHELRSPLNVILGFTQLLIRDSKLPEGVRHDLAAVYRSGHHLYTVINQVLDLSKIEAGRITLNEVEFDLYALLDELAEMFAIGAAQKGLHLAVDNAPQVPQHLHADALKLRQVLINLLNNALKFTQEGSVSLSVERRDSQAQQCVLRFAVTDTGAGIAEDELGQLGQAFVQAQAGRQTREGTGLGVAISTSFVQLMGGRLEWSSQLGRGTTVAFDLPVRLGEKPAAALPIEPGASVVGLAPDQPQYRIVVADDREDNRELLSRLLTPLGFAVRGAANGEEAVALWQEWQPHLIWMDIRMPVMSGREAARQIRARQSRARQDGQSTIIIALTASGFEQDRQQVLADGCDDFLRKPFREHELFDLMHQHLGVQFTYADQANQAATSVPDAAKLRALPAALLDQLEAALTGLEVNAVEQLIDQVREHDGALADAFAGMARHFEYQRMREIIGTRLDA